MGALPKQRIPKSRRGRRRNHQRLTTPSMVTCPNCRAYKLSHHVCLSCGHYAGREVVEIQFRTPSSGERPPS